MLVRMEEAFPFELWRENGVVNVVFSQTARIDVPCMKDLLRLIAALDPLCQVPVLVQLEAPVRMDNEARQLLVRQSQGLNRPVALLSNDMACRSQGEMLAHLLKPLFPFRTFAWREEADRWVEGWSRSPSLRVVS
ncbi:MAG: hypothetical protein JNM31_09165 [Flavobacteriales bacterium]|nr:hypothetical protein [Flavobacteriales bacterium]